MAHEIIDQIADEVANEAVIEVADVITSERY